MNHHGKYFGMKSVQYFWHEYLQQCSLWAPHSLDAAGIANKWTITVLAGAKTREPGKNVRLKIYTEVSGTMYPQTNILNMQSEDRLNFFYTLSHQRKKEDTGGSGILGMKFSLPEIQGIFQMFQSRLKGCVCRAGMATMLIGGEFRMRGGYSTGTNAELNIWPKKSPPLSMKWQNWWWQGGHGVMP